MASSSSPGYLIYDPQTLSFSNIFSILFYPGEFLNYEFVTCNLPDPKFKSFYYRLMMVVTWIIQKLLLAFGSNLKWVGDKVEYTLNLLWLNGGVLGLFLNYIRGSLKNPKQGTANFRSIISHTDERTNLKEASSNLGESVTVGTIGMINTLDLCAIIAKLAYENKAYVENVVSNHWKMHFVEFYDSFNETLQERATQSFIFCDRQEDAQLIVVAFRGTEPFNPKDWLTDFDISWFEIRKVGKVHQGFMQALGMQDKKVYETGWPKNLSRDEENRKFAYYAIREKLRALLKHNKNAKILVTGHSLGGALAILFPCLLVLHQEDAILNSLTDVYTFGQPRVGDASFGNYMKKHFIMNHIRYKRVVYRYDIVPRLPFKEPIINFSHFGGCIYYTSWYNIEVLDKEPNENYLNILYFPTMHFHALLDLLRALTIGITEGKDFEESWCSILLRIVGLFIPGAGVASHSPRDYVNGARLWKMVTVKVKKISHSGKSTS
ncbi:hypothetical protein HHK36_014696 [Tetracentron sinense]|uniref:Fungal lipase-type domain-containing protein n=1 Tax=Tetracentron sinense TaxID=13715 RepID=A0A835DCY5_TETSI|nr:hypothetical protein HHK36_014696 [Tetracentron sinense]